MITVPLGTPVPQWYHNCFRYYRTKENTYLVAHFEQAMLRDWGCKLVWDRRSSTLTSLEFERDVDATTFLLRWA